MKILYATDLHGDKWKYDQLYTSTLEHKPDVVINGGDMLPKQGDLLGQGNYINNELNEHFQLFNDLKTYYLCCLGNDDLRIFDPVLENICQKYEYISNLAQRKISIKNIDFIGMNWVVDYPFRLKDRCRMDTLDYIFPQQFGTGVLSTAKGWEEINNWYKYAKTLPTIEDELSKLPIPDKNQDSVYVIHMPPANLGLDVCSHGAKVGSKALLQFLEKNQSKLSLHGHIHESPDMSGVWKTNIGETVCIQPGQMSPFSFVVVDIETMDAQRYFVDA